MERRLNTNKMGTAHVSLYVAPAACGKTAYLIDLARELARDPAAAPRVIVPTRLQARAWRERLAQAGGALGVRIGTFDDVYREILRQAGIGITRLSDPVQVRLLRTVIDDLPLIHYGAIRRMPGFVRAVRDLIGELKAGGVFPEALQAALDSLDAPPRLTELAALYAAYQGRLQAAAWADDAGIGWLAAEALRDNAAVAAGWTCVMVDGFDDLTSVQRQVLVQLAPRIGRMVITLTGYLDGPERALVHRRFIRTRARLEEDLGVTAEPLPVPGVCGDTVAPLRHLEQTLYTDGFVRLSAGAAVTMVAVPDREAEVRAALRWIKTALVRREMRPGETALLARDLAPYRDFILQTAAEYGLPVQVATGYELRGNPAVATLVELLHVAEPGEGYLAWRSTVAVWRSPYFDWQLARVGSSEELPIGMTPEDAEALGWVARWGSVIGGAAQWEEAFGVLRESAALPDARDEETSDVPHGVPTGERAEALWGTFSRFCRRITPPGCGGGTMETLPYRDHVAWLEQLIGDVDDEADPWLSLGIARRAARGPAALVERDLAALNALKDVLRGLVWAEEAVGSAPVTFADFLEELLGAIEAVTYHVPLPADADVVLAAEVAQARGLAYRAVAVLGLAEGEFPATLSEDPFLPDADRRRLREGFGLPVADSLDSFEAQALYEALTRPREALLLTRPRIADNGTAWQPSPFWEEVRQRLEIEPQTTTSAASPVPTEAASWPELVTALSVRSDDRRAWAWVQAQRPALVDAITRGQSVLAQRRGLRQGAFDGELAAWASTFAARFGPSRSWSASRLEGYRRCPFSFFVGHLLGLAPRQPPTEGLDGRQLGNIYHHILEALYQQVGEGAEEAALLAALPEVAMPILDAAPRREGFRATAWWAQTRQAILENLRRSVTAIEALGDGFTFFEAEHRFGLGEEGGPSLVVPDGEGDSFRLRGLIDRVDRDGAGRVRIVDYKTAGPTAYSNARAHRGEILQLPLYALAARDALRLGHIAEGFYWHVQHAQPSSLSLSGFRGDRGRGPQAAIETATTYAWEAVRGARGGHFAPTPPNGGCPAYCPAAGFCWHYEARRW